MKHRILLAALGAGAVGLIGCAKPPVETAPGTSADISVSENARWTGNIQSVTQSRGDVAPSTRDRSYGSFVWSRGDGPQLTNFNLVFTYAGQERFLSWAIVAGSCGVPSLPLVPLSNFPEINIGGSGRGQVTGPLPIAFPTTGSYHVDIYRSRQQSMDALVACGNLKLVGG
jgi:hypothetical protein